MNGSQNVFVFKGQWRRGQKRGEISAIYETKGVEIAQLLTFRQTIMCTVGGQLYIASTIT